MTSVRRVPAFVLILVGLAIAALVVAQVALPRIAASRIERRLTESGGDAHVEVRSLPAHRLLSNGGDRLTVRGSGVTIGLGGGSAGRPAGLNALDGFAEVDVELVGLRAGPFDVDAFVLVRRDAGPYAMAAEGTISGSELVSFGETWLRSAIPGGGLLGTVAGSAPLSSRRVPVAVEIEIHSEPSGLRVGSGGGRIAGYPAGPIATTIAAAVARHLEIVP